MATAPRDALHFIETVPVLLQTTLAAALLAETVARASVGLLGVDPAGAGFAPGEAARAATLASLSAWASFNVFWQISERPALPFVVLVFWAAALSLLVRIAGWMPEDAGAAAIGGVLLAHAVVVGVVVIPYLRLARR